MNRCIAYLFLFSFSIAFGYETFDRFSKVIEDSAIVYMDDFDCEEERSGSEEGSDEKDDNDEKNEWSLDGSALLTLSHHISGSHQKPNGQWIYIAPYFEINSPPPELS